MPKNSIGTNAEIFFDSKYLGKLIGLLAEAGYAIVGPVRRDNAIIYDRIDNIDQLPRGWRDEQKPGYYRLKQDERELFFNFAVGPNSLKTFLFPPFLELWQARKTPRGMEIFPNNSKPKKIALIGVRACELAALAVHDRVLSEDKYKDRDYEQRRKSIFIVGVNCTRAGGTCFCKSMGTGPRISSGYDISLIEIKTDDYHGFVADSGSEKGRTILSRLRSRKASETDLKAAAEAIANAESGMELNLDTDGIQARLSANVENPHWDKVAERCQACSNCTMVCPTCFCTTIVDSTDLTGATASRSRKWDSCFRLDYSYIHGGSIRQSIKSRYRQWLMHKLSSWVDQFGTFGCVGCGRCITWCPVGINIVEEAKAISHADRKTASLIKVEE